MRFEILTLFPEMLRPFFEDSIIGQARQASLITVACTDIRAYTTNKHRRVDDAPYGGGRGLVLQCQPVIDCIRAVKEKLTGKTRVVYMSPQGRKLTTEIVKELAGYDNLVLLCGHYEGIDERILELEIDEEISVGDYVLTGGELPAAIVVDAVARRVPSVLPAEECFEEESHSAGLLEYPHYTRPRVYEGLEVPEVLFSGHHAEIAAWRHAKALERTVQKRPDLVGVERGELNEGGKD